MAKAKKIKQLIFTLPNRVGLLSDVSVAVTKAKVNINVITAYKLEKKAHFMLSVDNNAKAKKALSKLKIKAKDDKNNSSKWKCNNCGEMIESQFTDCWNCGESN